jgi:hypothetical protein
VQLSANCLQCGRFSLEGEWIYFRPSIDTSILSETRSIGAMLSTNKSVNIIPPFRSGWRIAANYLRYNDLDNFSVRWTDLRVHEKKFHSGGNFLSLAGGAPLASVQDSLKLSYHALEGIYSYAFLNCCNSNATFLAGFQYAWVSAKQNAILTTPLEIQTVKQNGRFWGIGPEIGLSFGIGLCDGFSIVGSGTSALLVSRLHESITATNIFTINRLCITPLWRVVPAWDLRAGLRYDQGYCLVSLYLEIGYEVLHYARSLKLLDISSDISSFAYSNFDMHGPYLSFGCDF